jgi:hypothetical protein
MGEISKYTASELEKIYFCRERADKSDVIKMAQNGMGAKATIKTLLTFSLISFINDYYSLIPSNVLILPCFVKK